MCRSESFRIIIYSFFLSLPSLLFFLPLSEVFDLPFETTYVRMDVQCEGVTRHIFLTLRDVIQKLFRQISKL